MFGAALLFWEYYGNPKERREKLMLLQQGETTTSSERLRYLIEKSSGGRKTNEDDKESTEYRTKCVAILSHYPFFQGYKKALKLLYRVAMGGQSTAPIERYVSNLVLSVPLPSPGTNVVLGEYFFIFFSNNF